MFMGSDFERLDEGMGIDSSWNGTTWKERDVSLRMNYYYYQAEYSRNIMQIV